MMRNKKRAFFILIPFIATATFILFFVGAVFSFVYLIKTTSFEASTFHRPANVVNLTNNYFQINNSDSYFLKGESLYKTSSDEKIEEINISFGKEGEQKIFCSYYDGHCFYFYVHLLHKSVEGIDRIVVTDTSFNETQSIYINDNIRTMMTIGDYLYYFYDCSLIDGAYEYVYGLAKINLLTLEKTIIEENIDYEKDYFFIDGESIMLLQCDNLSRSKLSNAKDGLFYTWNRANFSCYHPAFGKINLSKDKKSLSIKYDKKIVKMDLPNEHLVFYDYAYIKDESLLFGLYEYLVHDDCTSNYCICHYGTSSLFKLDLNSGLVSTIAEYDSGTVLIDYDEYGAEYYYNGGLYDHDRFIEECPKIENRETVSVASRTVPNNLIDYYYLGYFEGKVHLYVKLSND